MPELFQQMALQPQTDASYSLIRRTKSAWECSCLPLLLSVCLTFSFLFSLKASENRESSVWLQSQAEWWAELLPWCSHSQRLQGTRGLVRLSRLADELDWSLLGVETQVLAELWLLLSASCSELALTGCIFSGKWPDACMLYLEKWIHNNNYIISYHIMYCFNCNGSYHLLRSYCVPSTMLIAFICHLTKPSF